MKDRWSLRTLLASTVKISRYGLSVADVQGVIEVAVGGKEAG